MEEQKYNMPADIKCDECKWRAFAETHPKTFRARLWRWHTGWCPGWKKYQAYLAEEKLTIDNS